MRKPTTLLMLILMLSSLAGGQVPNLPAMTDNADNQPTTNVAAAPAARQLTATDVESFLDGIVPLQIAQDDIAGATFVVVKDGKVLFQKGYGYADVKTKKPVAPEETLFRIGSVSKLFTWTAVMQLNEQGKLDLDRDINEYLDFKIPDAHGKPITLKNILTHTAGFEEQVKDLFKYDAADLNLGEYLKTHVPKRIFAPGTVPAYSNYATALAGYIVERVSGQPFDDYVEGNIFRPLGMTHSTFRQPLPPELAPLMSSGYTLASVDVERFEVIPPAPAGSMSSSAGDMARFMLAHLQQGEFNGARILKPETVARMHSRLFGMDDASLGMAHGFYEESRNGRRIIGHGGDTVYFHSDLHLVQNENLGFFMSYNSGGRGRSSLRESVWKSLLDRYYPAAPLLAPGDAPTENAQLVSGTYMLSRRGDSSFIKALGLFGQASVAPADQEGTIIVSALMQPNGQPKRWRQIAPMVFREVDGQDTLVFKADETGRMQAIPTYPFMIFQRVGWWENGSILQIVLGLSLLVMLLTLALTFVAWLVRRHYSHKLEWTPTEKWLRFGVWVVFALDLIFIFAMVGLLTYGFSNLDFLSDRSTAWFFLAQAIGVVGAIGTILILANAAYSWLNRRNRIWSKLGATVLALASLGFLWFVFAANLLSFSSTY